MASKRVCGPVRVFINGTVNRSTIIHQHQPSLTRSLATDSLLPTDTAAQSYSDAHLSSTATQPILNDTFARPPPPAPAPASQTPFQTAGNPFLTRATCTLHSFPSLEPTGIVSYPDSHLLLPLRRDILHRAVVFEGDATRQGTASTKWRDDVHGSGRKIRPQKGTGSARLGDKKSPMLKGGGVAFGPKPRDFSTGLPKKMYDLAWRTALSYRYRRGQLVVVDGEAEVEEMVRGPGAARWVREMLGWHGWGKAGGRSLFVTLGRRERLFEALDKEGMGKEARAITVEDVDVKDLLETGRVVVEKEALDLLFRDHVSDLRTNVKAV
ncbi:54S ribosomal protein yml6, mitochondrial [Taxawa tesnikishii (nom. ined.)]|nr:54S ribosomal protein yml6, mitochondrial [Dothideales sp. JES 119]